MNGSQLWLAAAALQALLFTVNCAHHRRTLATQATLPVSKGGWRPVVGSSGLLYSSFGTAPLHAPSYKIPVPVLDMQYQSSARPTASRDTAKLTSIAQSYRPTTLRSAPASQPTPLLQPINSYHNPFQIQNNGILLNNGQSYYKHIQNYPVDGVLIRNPHNPYAARPVYPKYQNKFKQQSLQNNVLQQLTSIQPIQFAQYQTAKPFDVYGQPVESYSRPTQQQFKNQQQSLNQQQTHNHQQGHNQQQSHTQQQSHNQQQSGGTEIYKQEVYKLPDSESSQTLSKVKTAQQQTLAGQGPFYNFPQYSFQDTILPPSILGSFGSFGLQSVKGRDPIYPTKTTFIPHQNTKQTIFNSFSYSPNFRTTPTVYSTTTPRVLTTNQAQYSSTYSDIKITPTPSTKVSTAPKIDPNLEVKDGFKPSPNDPFMKYYQSDYNKIAPTTYNPLQTTSNNVYEYSFQAQNPQRQHYDSNNAYYDNSHKTHDNVQAGGHQQPTKQYIDAPVDTDSSLHAPVKPTYEVTENVDSDVITHSSPPSWSLTSQSSDPNEKEEKKQEYNDYGRPYTTNLPEEYAIVTEAEKGYENYDGIESQSRRPLGDDFEPIGKHRLKDYYSYKVSTPSYDDMSVTRRTKRPTESSKYSSQVTTTTVASTETPLDNLPTLPPSKHFKRPTSTTEMPPLNGIRKRTKIRRRRPPLANLNRNRTVDEQSTYPTSSSTEPTQTETSEVHTIKPRVRPSTNGKLQTSSTTPSVTTDLTTSAIPTISPTFPSIIKKKLIHRRPTTITPTEKIETTTQSFKVYETKESPIMKIANRHNPKPTSYEFKSSEAPDYTHKQDEKDTPTSDTSVNLNDAFRTTDESEQEFAFHKDVKPIEAKLEPVTYRFRETTTDSDFSNEVTTFAPRAESNVGKVQRPRLRNKYNRPKFSVKDYKSRMSSTTPIPERSERPIDTPNKFKFPLRRTTESSITETDTTTERKKFTPKDPRFKTTVDNETERETYTVRQSVRQRQTTQDVESTTQKMSSRIRNGNRRPRPTEESTEALSTRRPLRKKIKDSDISESVQDISVTETVYDFNKDQTSERTRSESAIMKIADKKHHDSVEHLFEHSQRVSDLTLAASKDYNKPGMFKTISSNSRRIPNYFTIATDDPILPIEAFFPQLNQKKET